MAKYKTLNKINPILLIIFEIDSNRRSLEYVFL